MLTSPADKILSAGVVIVHHDGDRFRLLALRTFEHWDFPKALVADGDDPLQTALRAVENATGLTELEFNWGEEYRETVPFEDGNVSRYYIGQSTDNDVTLTVPPGEGSLEDYEYAWVTADEAEDILPPRLAIVLDWAVRTLVAGARN
jgi:bis(5'-nucleosidyl)-tetraphosphatase